MKIRAPFEIEQIATDQGPATLVKAWGIIRTLHLTGEFNLNGAQRVRQITYRWGYRVVFPFLGKVKS